MGKNSAIGVLSFSVANRRRDFLLPSVAASASLVWQRPASWFNSTPRFLAAQRSAVSSLGEEVAQREPLKGFPLDAFGNKRAAALLRSRGVEVSTTCPMGQSSTGFGSTLFLACKYPLVCKISDDFSAEQQIWKTCSPQGIFALQKSLRGGLRWGTGVLIAEQAVPAQRNFQRKFALRRVGSAKFVVPPITERSKVRRHAQLVQPSVPGSLGCQRGRAPLFPKESRENPSKGFLWATSSPRLDTALLCAAKKRGVESPGWQASASGTLAPAPRQEVKRQPRQARPNLNLSLKPSQGFYKLRCCSAAAANEARAGFDKPLYMLRKLA